MADVSSPFEGIKKVRLSKASPMFVNRLRGAREFGYLCLEFTVKGFTGIEKDHAYNHAHYSLVKSDTDVTIQLFTLFNETFRLIPVCYVYQRISGFQGCGQVTELKTGIYEMTIALEQLKFLPDDVLRIGIRFNPQRRRDIAIRPMSGRDVGDYYPVQLSEDLSCRKSEFLRDCMLFSGAQFNILPKGLCAARSSLIREYLARDSEAKILDVPCDRYLNLVAFFMQYGWIEMSNEPVKPLRDVAKIMGIPGIESYCSAVIKDEEEVLAKYNQIPW